MLKINLLPRSEARRGQTSNSAASLLLVGVVGSLVLLISGLFLFQTTQQSEVDTLISQNTQIQGQIDAIKSRVADHQKVRDELAEIRRREEAITGLQNARTGPTAMLVEISHILSPNGRPTVDPLFIDTCRQNAACRDRLWSTTWEPHRLWLTTFEEVNRNVKISGEGRTADDVGEVMRRLQLSLYFQNVRLDRTESNTSVGVGGQLAVQRFTIVAKVRY